jgi:predicted metal-dependent HD superfamily phosphohydrolase
VPEVHATPRGLRAGRDDPLAALVDRWRAVLAPFAHGDAVTAVGRALFDRYDEPHRRYHTRAHLGAVVGALFLDLAPDPVSVELAAFFHDAVYDPRAPAGANERDSAALAGAWLGGLGVPAAVLDEVERLVLTTIGHHVAVGDAAGAVLNDADLAVLGAPGPAYAAYTQAVRAEYRWLDDASWRIGRSAVLRGLLDRPRLFMTARGFAQREGAARENIAGELRALAE